MPPVRACSHVLKTPDDARRVFAGLAAASREAAAFAYLGPERRLLGLRHIAGAADSVGVPVARIARDALTFGAGALVMAHSHPGDDPRPSAADLALTRRLAQGLAVLDIVLLDHLIVARKRWISLREQGML